MGRRDKHTHSLSPTAPPYVMHSTTKAKIRPIAVLATYCKVDL